MLDDLHAADDLALGVVDRLAVLGGDQARELVRVPVDELAEAEHDARAAHDRDVLPAIERPLRGVHGGVDVGRLGEQHTALFVTGRRVVDRRAARRCTGGLLAGDAVLDGFKLDGAHGVLAVS